MLAAPRFADRADGEHRVGIDDFGDLGADLHRLADLHRHAIDLAVDRGADGDLVQLGLGRGQRRLGRGDAGLECRQIVARLIAPVDQLLVGVVLGLALVEQRLRLIDRRLASLVGDPADDGAGLDHVAAVDREAEQNAGAAGRCARPCDRPG